MPTPPDPSRSLETAGEAVEPAGDGLTTRAGLKIAAAVLVVGAVAIYGYYRHLVGSILEDAPLAFEAPASPPEETLHRLEDRLAAARAGGAAATLNQDELNALLFAEVAASPAERAVRLDLIGPGTIRLRSRQRDARAGRWLNADLTGTMGMLPPEGRLGFVFREGRVGGVSLGGTAGQWARAKIERQLGHEIATNERTARALKGLADVRISPGRVEFRFIRP